MFEIGMFEYSKNLKLTKITFRSNQSQPKLKNYIQEIKNQFYKISFHFFPFFFFPKKSLMSL